MISIIVDMDCELKKTFMKASHALVLLIWILYPVSVSAEWLTVEMEGAREAIHLDTTNGALYVGSDCAPFFYFSEVPQRRSKMFKQSGKIYSVQKSRSRSSKKSALPSRLPSAIIVDGNSVKVLSETLAGQALAKGKVKASVLAGRKKAAQCK